MTVCDRIDTTITHGWFGATFANPLVDLAIAQVPPHNCHFGKGKLRAQSVALIAPVFEALDLQTRSWTTRHFTPLAGVSSGSFSS